ATGTGGGGGGSGTGGSGGSGNGGGATEICNDGIDNNGNRAIDCNDASCLGNALCMNLPDGAGCAADAQCASGRCLTESAYGFPNGYCTNTGSCTLGSNVGCHGGRCVMGSPNNTCRALCNGTGL